jgi:tetratricopeptide (TPR) repeat protein
MRSARVLLPFALLACSQAAADHERLGDRAYREGRFAAAVAEYRAAAKDKSSARVLAKLGSAALHARELALAIESFRGLAQEDPARAAEAAVGLERAAYLAARGGPAELLQLAAAVRGIRAVAPGRPLGRAALVQVAQLEPAEALGALPAALAAASSGRTVDSLLLVYGEAQQVTTACEAATHTYAAVLRRARDAGLRSSASRGLAGCALRLGLDALAAEQNEPAERWFERALSAAPGTPEGWRAAIGQGDARLRQGDPLGAAIAYQSVLSAAAVPDSLNKLAGEKLNALANPGAP